VRRLRIIGIGAGDPDYITVQAIKALNTVDVFFMVEKGEQKASLVDLRRDLIERHVENRAFRMADIRDPERDRTAGRYGTAVAAWRHQRALAYEAAIRDHLGEDECGGFLVWGDPSLYDSTLGIVEEIVARGALAITYDVIPGISSVQSLTARHRTNLNRIGESIQITTGRRLSEGWPSDAENVVVMLDARSAFTNLDPDDLDIYWGAYLGTPDELLVAGRLADVAGEIERVRAEARARHGWIMDTYLLRRRPPE
jgi:precorrin-6A synthase